MSREQLISSGWRRHSVISPTHGSLSTAKANLPQKIQEKLAIPGSILLVATYDCAVVFGCFEDEPWVQLLIATPVVYNKQFASGRDSRRIHIKIGHKDEETAYEVNASGICQIDRALLCQIQPDFDYQLSDTCKYDLKHWLAERFRQDTWPDAFNNAIRPARNRLKSFFGRYNKFLSGIYLRLNTYEELINCKYEACAILLIESSKYRAFIKHLRDSHIQNAKKSIDELMIQVINELLVAFGNTIGFTPDPTTVLKVAVEVVDESMITVHQQRTYYRFSPYSLSEFDMDAPLPVEMTPAKSI